MKKIELEEQNRRLKEKIEELEKQIDNSHLLSDINKLYEIRDLLFTELNFCKDIIFNLTRKDDNNETI